MNIKDFKFFNKIIIVDDNEIEGNTIREALEQYKIPSIFYHIKSTSDLPEKPFNNLRIIFLDLIFSQATGLNPRISASIALTNLSKFISKNSFYTLVVWSSHTTEETYNEFVNQLNRENDICKPIKIFPINKSIIHTPHEIPIRIEEIFEDIPLLNILTQWEYIVENSLSNTLNSLIPPGSNNNYFSQLLNSLATGSSGIKTTKSNIPKQALGLLNYILDDNISKELEIKKFGTITRKINSSLLTSLDKSKLNHNLIFDPNISFKGSGSMYKKNLSEKDKKEKIKIFIEQDLSGFQNVVDNIQFFYIDVTPLCDSANDKGYSYFVESILHPKIYKIATKSGGDIKAKKGYCYTINKYFDIDGTEYGLIINLKSYCTDKTLIKRCSSKRKLRNNIVIDIQHKLGEHLSRPGHKLL